MRSGHTTAGPLDPTRRARAVLRPLGYGAVELDEAGMLGAWQALNRASTIGHCIAQLEAHGHLGNFRRLAGRSDAGFAGFRFSDSDVYKVLEAVGWESGRGGDAGWTPFVDELAELMRAVREDDGYLNTWTQGVAPDRRWRELASSHELYCLGHLIQGALALARGTGREDVLEVATGFADLIVREGQDLLDGHPEIETALVELYRHTGREEYLALASRMIERRGRGLLGPVGFGSAYIQDHLPVREATEATGHAVRQLYLAAGVTDVYLETGDETLLEAMQALWRSAFGEKTYITGAHGSRHRDEAFGDPFELPPDRAYAETCAAIASFMWNWRLLVATGEGRFAEEMERALYNGIAVAMAVDGRHFFYSNPLQLREGHDGSDEDAPSERLSWYSCACCPPNLARLLASLHHYVATGDGGGIQLHLLTAGRVEAGPATLRVDTAYPWDGRVEIAVEAGAGEWELALRIPAWCREPRLDGTAVEPGQDGYVRLRRRWSPGDRVVLELPLPVRLIAAHPRVDAVRGCLAIARGPLVYCIEQADHAEPVEELRLDPARPPRPAGADPRLGVEVTLSGPASVTAAAPPALYQDHPAPAASRRETTLTAIPYYRWGNRGANAMRVWIPTSPA